MATKESLPIRNSPSESDGPPPPFDLTQYGITVRDVRRNLAPARLYAEAIREEDKCDIADTGASDRLLGRQDGPQPQGQADRQASRLKRRCLVGDGQYSRST